MSWVLLGLVSAFFLGLYDIAKKSAVHKNAALSTLLCCTSIGASFCAGALICREVQPQLSPWLLTNQVLSWNDHLAIALKGLIVSTSWMFAYLSLKHLPISIVSPIRASGPLWTLMGAVLIYGEIPTALQGFGFLLTMVSYIFVSILGQKEGIRFSRNPWIACIVMGTLVGALSGLYDKYLIAKRGLHPTDVQLWFSVHMVWVQALMLAIAVKMKWEKMSTFQWRWSMAIVGVLLLAADAAYFRAITDMEAQIGLLSGIRRASLLFSFGIGAVMFKDKNLRKKALPVLGVFMGIVILSWSSSS